MATSHRQVHKLQATSHKQVLPIQFFKSISTQITLLCLLTGLPGAICISMTVGSIFENVCAYASVCLFVHACVCLFVCVCVCVCEAHVSVCVTMCVCVCCARTGAGELQGLAKTGSPGPELQQHLWLTASGIVRPALFEHAQLGRQQVRLFELLLLPV
jgi:hypothetical protein